jgi:hypothetical protein
VGHHPEAQFEVKPPKRGAKKRAPDSALTRFETEFGVPLPPSYREFVERLGPGEFGGYFRVYAPGYGGKGLDLAALVTLLRENADIYEGQYGDAPLVARMIPFADTIGGDVFVWDTGKPVKGEYPILALISGGTKPIKVAPTFAAFVMDVVLGGRFGKLVKNPDFEAGNDFLPYSKPA